MFQDGSNESSTRIVVADWFGIRRHRTPTSRPPSPDEEDARESVKPRRRGKYRPPTRHAPHRRAYPNRVRSTTAGTPASEFGVRRHPSTPLPGTLQHRAPPEPRRPRPSESRRSTAARKIGPAGRTCARTTAVTHADRRHARERNDDNAANGNGRPGFATRHETESSPTRSSGLVRLPPNGFTYSLNSLFKVLFNFTSRYLFAIGLVVVFSLRWSLPPA